MKQGDCYAIERGKYTGKFIVFILEYDKFYQFLMMPGDFKVLKISKEQFEKALDPPNLGDLSEIKVPPYINFVETVPTNIFEQIDAQYKEVVKHSKNIVNDLFGTNRLGIHNGLKNTNNRWH